jgi:5-methylcytosine-specific restriction endonuclease McrA|tara:strand:+ start:1240 stop:1722 length:483 start_codon:yes stop_codon:yes gene_type:complete
MTLAKKQVRVNKRTKFWEEKFLPKLKKHHGNRAKGVFHRLMKKSSTLRTSLKRRSKEYEVLFEISLREIRELIYSAYGRKCRYCKDILKVNNMVCDHSIPLSNGGESVPDNLQMICARCNTRKGPLTHKAYNKLLAWLKRQNQNTRDYILRKMARSDVFK